MRLDNNSERYAAYKNKQKIAKEKKQKVQAKKDSIEDAKWESQYKAEQARKRAKVNSEYPTVASVYGSQRLTAFSSTKLTHGIRLTSEIIDLGADSMKNYHVLLKANGTYVLLVVDHTKSGKLSKGDTITVYGMFNGKSRINTSQIGSGISASYYSKPCVLLMADKVVNQDE